MLLVQRGLAETRERAQAYILAGLVEVEGARATRPAQPIAADAVVAVRSEGPRLASRGGLKLREAFRRWPLELAVDGRVALDVGASTGGFTDVLLQHGARRVYAVDVGYGQLLQRLRQDPRVVAMERTNVRHLASLPEPVELAVADVSFISLRLALPPVFPLLTDEAPIVALVKPQFEAGPKQVGKGGVVRDVAVHRRVLLDMIDWSARQPWRLSALAVSPIRGPAGNVEFLSLWRRGVDAAGEAQVVAALEESTRLEGSGGG